MYHALFYLSVKFRIYRIVQQPFFRIVTNHVLPKNKNKNKKNINTIIVIPFLVKIQSLLDLYDICEMFWFALQPRPRQEFTTSHNLNMCLSLHNLKLKILTDSTGVKMCYHNHLCFKIRFYENVCPLKLCSRFPSALSDSYKNMI